MTKLDNLEQQLRLTLSEVAQIKEALQGALSENATLRIENSKLRDRLAELDTQKSSSVNQAGKASLAAIYDDGFHICNVLYGQKMLEGESCQFCMEILDR